MANSPDHPELQFIQASGYTRGRPDGPPLWIVVHDMEANEAATTAEATANYFATGAGGRSVSSHYTADSDSVVQCVLLKDVAWTVGNRPGNYRGINWEFAGFASQSREEWLDPFGVAMFTGAAPIIRADAARFGIPLERRSVDELQAFVPGVTSHNDLRLAFGVTDHTDPGPNFPWDWFIALLNGQEDDMTPEEARLFRNTVNVISGWATGKSEVNAEKSDGTIITQDISGLYKATAATVIAQLPPPGDTTVVITEAQIIAAVKTVVEKLTVED